MVILKWPSQNIQQKKKPLTNTKKIAETSSTTKNDILVEVEPLNIQTNTIIKFHIQKF